MKMISNLSRKMLGSIVAFAMLALAIQASAESVAQVVTVIRVDGNARYQTPANKSWQEIKKGLVLKPGSVIQTAEGATVDIMLGEHDIMAPTPIGGASSAGTATPIGHSGGASAAGNDNGPKNNIIRIFPSSVLAIDKLTVERTGVDEVEETQLDLRAGQILGNVKKLSAASRYEVKLPNGVAGIRGTIYVVSASGGVTVLTGSVVVSYVGAGGVVYTQTVSAGQTFNPFAQANGTIGTQAGPGQLTTTPPALAAALLAQEQAANGPNATTPATTVNKNNTLIHISPN